MSVNVTDRFLSNVRSNSTDDRVLFITRLLAGFIVPVLVIAFLILYLFPSYSDILFAWAIGPPMTAMMLGAAYIGGAYYFARVLFAKQWHRIKLGLLPVTSFASFLGIATLVHWNNFTAGHPAFIMWALLYLTLPFVILLVWWLNRGADPMTLDEDDSHLSQNVRRFFWILGALLTLLSLIWLVVPEVLIDAWPWTLSPLTGRTMGAMFVLPGVVSLGIANDNRWSSARIILQAQIFSLLMILLAIVYSRDNFDWSQPVSWIFVVSMSALCIVLIGIYVTYRNRIASE